MDLNRLLEVVPHYIAMLILIFTTLAIVRTVVGDLGFWIEFAIILVVAFAYRPLVIWLDIAPSSWA